MIKLAAMTVTLTVPRDSATTDADLEAVIDELQAVLQESLERGANHTVRQFRSRLPGLEWEITE